ncbi:signal peptidase II [Mesorhizobium australicum]|uniref:Lipoprotein signal peptidase n=1 Tax=Mesorhizobium australicum TaxID=536018 RepID=A0A1X7NDQ2_9HYPH|nr:signal peptidase II [Mesorhizobium australicum]SMH35767.1 signal peptidase II Aspartic peptidase. MEROPS family A08 [Mesorhizobium australicum]
MSKRILAIYALVAVAAAGLDQWIKQLVVANMELYERIDVMPMLSLYHTRNTGIAFSFLSGLDDTIMVVLTGVVMLFIVWLAAKAEPHQHLARTGFALIVGGALGNIIDRSTLGYVVDYVLFHTQTWSFAVFNLADAFISVGAALVVLQEILDWRRGSAGAGRNPPDGA